MSWIQIPRSQERAFKVMIVEDDEAVALNLRQGLEAMGRDVCLAHSKGEALQRLSLLPEIAVVVTDIRMPGGSGLELAEAVRHSRKESAATEVIVIAGHATLQDVTIALRLGACDFLSKPFRLAEADAAIAKAAARALDRRATEEEKSGLAAAVSGLDRELAALRRRLAETQSAFQALSGGEAWLSCNFEKVSLAVSQALRTPLSAISCGAERIEAGTPLAQGPASLELLREGVQGAVAAIDLVEEFSRLRANDDPAVSSFDLTAYAEAAARQGGIARTPGQGSLEPVLMVTAAPLRIRRAVALCFAAALDWARPGSRILYGLEALPAEERPFGCLTITIASDGQEAAPPGGIALDQGPAGLTGTAECLRLLIARRLVAHCGGAVTAWSGPPRGAAIRLSLPLRLDG